MFYALLLVTHILVAVLLIVVILVQRGRGSGLVESLAGVESMFGTKTNVFLTRATAILAGLFLFTSISLALLAAHQSRSLINKKTISSSQKQTVKEGAQGEKTQPAESGSPQENTTE